MIYKPYQDESKIIDEIHKVRNSDYALLRITQTMVNKNDTDCNGIFRTMLKKMNVVDFDQLEHGSKNGKKLEALFIQSDKIDYVPMNFYVVTGDRGDRRMTIGSIGKRASRQEFNVGDLLYFSIFEKENKETQLFLINLTHNSPSYDFICENIGTDATNALFEKIKPLLKQIIEEGKAYPNYKGLGKEAPKDVGETLEALLKVETNNRNDADLEGLIELKGKGSKGTKDTLLTLRPSFEGTYIASVEENDKHRVKVFPLYYGYDSMRHAGCKDLYVTIGSKEAPQNQHGLYLEVDEKNNLIKLMGPSKTSKKEEMIAFWTFDALEKALNEKHPATLWITADKEEIDNQVWFNYKKIEFTRSPQFTAFVTLVKSGEITYDWRGHTSVSNKYEGINKGNAWRVKPRSRNELFGSSELIEFE